MSAYLASVSMQKLFAIMVAVAVLFAPVFTRASEAAAAVPDHQVQMMKSGHCNLTDEDSGDRDEAPLENCCVSTCMAVTASPPAPPAAPQIKQAKAQSAVRTFEIGAPAEIATPPPRFA